MHTAADWFLYIHAYSVICFWTMSTGHPSTYSLL